MYLCVLNLPTHSIARDSITQQYAFHKKVIRDRMSLMVWLITNEGGSLARVRAIGTPRMSRIKMLHIFIRGWWGMPSHLGITVLTIPQSFHQLFHGVQDTKWILNFSNSWPLCVLQPGFHQFQLRMGPHSMQPFRPNWFIGFNPKPIQWVITDQSYKICFRSVPYVLTRKG